MKSPDLNTVAKHEPFRVPEGYFDKLTGQVMARIDQQDSVTAHEAEGFARVGNHQLHCEIVVLL